MVFNNSLKFYLLCMKKYEGIFYGELNLNLLKRDGTNVLEFIDVFLFTPSIFNQADQSHKHLSHTHRSYMDDTPGW